MAYSRLRNLVRDQLSPTEIERFIDRKAREGWVGKTYEPERQHRILPADFENEDRFNNWLEETLCYLTLKRKQENYENDRDLLYLFRLLSMKFRAANPARCTKYPLRSDIELVMDLKICTCIMNIFERFGKKTKNSVKKSLLQ